MDTVQTARSSLIEASKVQSTSVFNPKGEKLGAIDDVMLDKRSGKAAYAIMSFGGFLGLGEKDVALPFNEFSFGRDAGGNVVVTAKVTKESLQSAPEWKNPEDR